MLFTLAAIVSFIAIPALAWTVLVAFMRKPRVRVEDYKGEGREDSIILGVRIINDPIYAWPFRALGVRRKGFDEVYCMYSVQNVITRRMIVDENLAALHDHKGGHHESAPLPAAWQGLYFPVAVWEQAGFGTVPDSQGTGRYVGPGTYRCVMLVHADELHYGLYTQDFTVGVSEEHFQWVGRMKRIRPLLEKLRRRFR